MKHVIILIGVVCLLHFCAPAPEPEVVPESKVDAQAVQTLEVINKWIDDVWMQGKLELVPELVGPTYVRHRSGRTSSVTPEEYAKVIAARREQTPDLKFIVHD